MYSPNGLGFTLPRWLTPPSWLKAEIAQHVGAAVKGTILSVPTESGTISFDLSDSKQWAAIGNMLKGIRVSRTATGGSAELPAPVAAGLGAGAMLLFGLGAFMLFGRGRSRA